jgi:hypothetical protein
MAYCLTVTPAGPITKFQLRPQFLREEPPILACHFASLPQPLFLIIRLFTLYQEISYSLALSGPSPEPSRDLSNTAEYQTSEPFGVGREASKPPQVLVAGTF